MYHNVKSFEKKRGQFRYDPGRVKNLQKIICQHKFGYFGEVKKGQLVMDGRGIMIYPTGRVICGTFKDSRCHGWSRYYFEDGA
jgi:hypothetical protein